VALLIHLRVLSVGRLRVTAVVTIWTVVRIAVGGGILSHALRKTWTLRAVLRSSAVARGCRLVPDGRELGVLGRLSRDADCLSHLSVNRRLRSASLVSALLHVGPVSLFVGFARGLLLLLLRFPLLSNFLEFFGSALLAVRLHRNVRIQMVQSAVSFLATIPSAFVHALNFFISPTWSLMLLCARNGYE